MNDDDDINPATIDRDTLNEACAFRAEADRIVDASESLKRSVRGRLDDEADSIRDRAYELRKQSQKPSGAAFAKTFEAIPELHAAGEAGSRQLLAAIEKHDGVHEAAVKQVDIDDKARQLLRKLCNPPIG